MLRLISNFKKIHDSSRHWLETISIFGMIFLGTETAQAVNFHTELYQGTRVKGMGGAYVGLADDHQTLFLNPAGLASVQDNVFYLSDTMMEGSEDAYSAVLKSFGALSGFSIATLNLFQGDNVYARAQTSPMFLMKNFGFGLIFDQQFAYFTKNLALPKITLGYQTTMGLQVAFGTQLSSGRHRPGNPSLNIGGAVKVLWRRGGYRQWAQSELLAFDGTIGLATELFGNFGMGLGIDLGAQYVLPMSRQLQLSFGTAFTDIGDTAFSSAASPQQGNWSAGLGVKYDAGLMDLSFAYDFRNILAPLDWRAKNHVGMEVGFPIVDLFVGINQAYLTYGVGVDVWVFKVEAVSYAEELSAQLFQDPNRRYMVRIESKIGF